MSSKAFRPSVARKVKARGRGARGHKRPSPSRKGSPVISKPSRKVFRRTSLADRLSRASAYGGAVALPPETLPAELAEMLDSIDTSRGWNAPIQVAVLLLDEKTGASEWRALSFAHPASVAISQAATRLYEFRRPSRWLFCLQVAFTPISRRDWTRGMHPIERCASEAASDSRVIVGEGKIRLSAVLKHYSRDEIVAAWFDHRIRLTHVERTPKGRKIPKGNEIRIWWRRFNAVIIT